jgi:molecular chaperone HtpG
VKRFRTEGDVDFTVFLFVSKRAHYDLFEPEKKLNNIKLYVRRVFVMSNSEGFIPEYFNFLEGIIDLKILHSKSFVSNFNKTASFD